VRARVALTLLLALRLLVALTLVAAVRLAAQAAARLVRPATVVVERAAVQAAARLVRPATVVAERAAVQAAARVAVATPEFETPLALSRMPQRAARVAVVPAPADKAASGAAVGRAAGWA